MVGGLMMKFLVYCNVDSEGEIIEGIAGLRLIPDKQYDHFFFLEKEVDLLKMRIEFDGCKANLVKKEESDE